MYRKRYKGQDLEEAVDKTVALDYYVDGAVQHTVLTQDDRAADSYVSSHNNDESSRAFFANKKPVVRVADDGTTTRYGRQLVAESGDDRTVRQSMRRISGLTSLLTALATRVDPGTTGQIVYVTFEEGRKLQLEYQDAVVQNRAKECKFQPLSAYAGKLIQTDDQGRVKRVIRQIFTHEFGVLTFRSGQSKIVLLKDQGPGDVGGKYHQVTQEIK